MMLQKRPRTCSLTKKRVRLGVSFKSHQPAMPRQFDTEISGNARTRRELTPYERGKIIGAFEPGEPISRINHRTRFG